MEQNSQPSYWTSVTIGALIISIVTSIAGLGLLYNLAGSEPSMSMMIMAGLFIPITCLFGGFGGFISNRHYAKTFDLSFPIGKGALIGFFTGLVAAVFSTLISLIWTNLIDPMLMENFANNMVSAFELIEMPEAQREQSINDIMADVENQNSIGKIFRDLGISAVSLGIINAISGIIGAKVFASEE